MRNLISILSLLIVSCTQAQVKVVGIPYTATTGTEIGTFINEPFNGSSLSGDWTVSGSPTITVSGGKCSVQGTSTVRDATQHISYTAYGYSTLDGFVIEVPSFQIVSIGTNGYGAMIGVKSNVATGFASSLWGIVNFHDNTLDMYGADGSDAFSAGAYVGSPPTLTVPINTTDFYLLRLTVTRNNAAFYLKNLATLDEQTLTYNWGWTETTNIPIKPNIFQYSFGVSGDSHISYEGLTISSTEHNYPTNLFVGNSITTGYMKNQDGSGNGYPEILATHTADVTEIAAGAGTKVADMADNLDEIIARHPARVFVMGGTNDVSDFTTGWTNLQFFITQLQDANIEVYPLLIVNGGNPATPGTFNYNIATTYPTKYIDTWTTGWNTMSEANGDMADDLHPTGQGFIKLANIIKSNKPAFFPLYIPFLFVVPGGRSVRRRRNRNKVKRATKKNNT